MLRIGAVSYLNARPVVYGLDARTDIALRFDVPSRCAALLEEGTLDLGLIPSIEIGRGGYAVVPHVALASDGPVASVALFTRRPIAEVEAIALDTSSRTSAALVRLLCDERWRIRPAFRQEAPDLDAMLGVADAALLIGDNALFADHAARGLEKIDLGAEWTAHTGLPFVWAMWAGRAGAVAPATVDALVEARDEGLAHLDEIAAAYAPGDAARRQTASRYLRENMKYCLGARHETAIRWFWDGAARLGLVEAPAPLRFYRGEQG